MDAAPPIVGMQRVRPLFSPLLLVIPLFLASAEGCTAGSVGGPQEDGGTTGSGGNGGSSGGGGTSGGGGDTDGGGGGGGGGSGDTDGGSRTIYCGPSSDSECMCTQEQSSQSLSATASCDLAGIGAPGLCCAIAGWPGVSGGAFGGCYCSKIFCETDGQVCQCGFGKPTAGDTPVSSCQPTTGEICCRSKSDIAPTCACYKGSQCVSSDDERVPSCGPTTLECAGSSVTSCR